MVISYSSQVLVSGRKVELFEGMWKKLTERLRTVAERPISRGQQVEYHVRTLCAHA